MKHLKGILFYLMSLMITYIYFPIIRLIYKYDLCDCYEFSDSSDDFITNSIAIKNNKSDKSDKYKID